MVRLISCHPDSNRNSAGEYVRVSENWLNVSKKFRPDINVVRVQELNFVLRSEIFVHYDGQLKAYHLILGYVPSYTSYQDLSSVLTVGNPLLLYLDVRLPGFLPQGLTSREAKHLGDLAEDGPLVKEAILDEPVQPNSVEEMVQKCSIALDHWFPATQASRGQAATRPTPQQTTPLASKQWRKRQKGDDGTTVESSTPPAAHLPTLASGQATTQPTGKTPQKT
uniref:Uncharacterized protein n=1 Tax=Quercus lobata TaxID=97700 RepID=A0A7N2MF03_QUELO